MFWLFSVVLSGVVVATTPPIDFSLHEWTPTQWGARVTWGALTTSFFPTTSVPADSLADAVRTEFPQVEDPRGNYSLPNYEWIEDATLQSTNLHVPHATSYWMDGGLTRQYLPLDQLTSFGASGGPRRDVLVTHLMFSASGDEVHREQCMRSTLEIVTSPSISARVVVEPGVLHINNGSFTVEPSMEVQEEHVLYSTQRRLTLPGKQVRIRVAFDTGLPELQSVTNYAHLRLLAPADANITDAQAHREFCGFATVVPHLKTPSLQPVVNRGAVFVATKEDLDVSVVVQQLAMPAFFGMGVSQHSAGGLELKPSNVWVTEVPRFNESFDPEIWNTEAIVAVNNDTNDAISSAGCRRGGLIPTTVGTRKTHLVCYVQVPKDSMPVGMWGGMSLSVRTRVWDHRRTCTQLPTGYVCEQPELSLASKEYVANIQTESMELRAYKTVSAGGSSDGVNGEAIVKSCKNCHVYFATYHDDTNERLSPYLGPEWLNALIWWKSDATYTATSGTIVSVPILPGTRTLVRAYEDGINVMDPVEVCTVGAPCLDRLAPGGSYFSSNYATNPISLGDGIVVQRPDTPGGGPAGNGSTANLVVKMPKFSHASDLIIGIRVEAWTNMTSLAEQYSLQTLAGTGHADLGVNTSTGASALPATITQDFVFTPSDRFISGEKHLLQLNWACVPWELQLLRVTPLLNMTTVGANNVVIPPHFTLFFDHDLGLEGNLKEWFVQDGHFIFMRVPDRVWPTLRDSMAVVRVVTRSHGIGLDSFAMVEKLSGLYTKPSMHLETPLADFQEGGIFDSVTRISTAFGNRLLRQVGSGSVNVDKLKFAFALKQLASPTKWTTALTAIAGTWCFIENLSADFDLDLTSPNMSVRADLITQTGMVLVDQNDNLQQEYVMLGTLSSKYPTRWTSTFPGGYYDQFFDVTRDSSPGSPSNFFLDTSYYIADPAQGFFVWPSNKAPLFSTTESFNLTSRFRITDGSQVSVVSDVSRRTPLGALPRVDKDDQPVARWRTIPDISQYLPSCQADPSSCSDIAGGRMLALELRAPESLRLANLDPSLVPEWAASHRGEAAFVYEWSFDSVNHYLEKVLHAEFRRASRSCQVLIPTYDSVTGELVALERSTYQWNENGQAFIASTSHGVPSWVEIGKAFQFSRREAAGINNTDILLTRMTGVTDLTENTDEGFKTELTTLLSRSDSIFVVVGLPGHELPINAHPLTVSLRLILGRTAQENDRHNIYMSRGAHNNPVSLRQFNVQARRFQPLLSVLRCRPGIAANDCQVPSSNPESTFIQADLATTSTTVQLAPNPFATLNMMADLFGIGFIARSGRLGVHTTGDVLISDGYQSSSMTPRLWFKIGDSIRSSESKNLPLFRDSWELRVQLTGVAPTWCQLPHCVQFNNYINTLSLTYSSDHSSDIFTAGTLSNLNAIYNDGLLDVTWDFTASESSGQHSGFEIRYHTVNDVLSSMQCKDYFGNELEANRHHSRVRVGASARSASLRVPPPPNEQTGLCAFNTVVIWPLLTVPNIDGKLWTRPHRTSLSSVSAHMSMQILHDGIETLEPTSFASRQCGKWPRLVGTPTEPVVLVAAENTLRKFGGVATGRFPTTSRSIGGVTKGAITFVGVSSVLVDYSDPSQTPLQRDDNGTVSEPLSVIRDFHFCDSPFLIPMKFTPGSSLTMISVPLHDAAATNMPTMSQAALSVQLPPPNILSSVSTYISVDLNLLTPKSSWIRLEFASDFLSRAPQAWGSGYFSWQQDWNGWDIQLRSGKAPVSSSSTNGFTVLQAAEALEAHSRNIDDDNFVTIARNGEILRECVWRHRPQAGDVPPGGVRWGVYVRLRRNKGHARGFTSEWNLLPRTVQTITASDVDNMWSTYQFLGASTMQDEFGLVFDDGADLSSEEAKRCIPLKVKYSPPAPTATGGDAIGYITINASRLFEEDTPFRSFDMFVAVLGSLPSNVPQTVLEPLPFFNTSTRTTSFTDANRLTPTFTLSEEYPVHMTALISGVMLHQLGLFNPEFKPAWMDVYLPALARVDLLPSRWAHVESSSVQLIDSAGHAAVVDTVDGIAHIRGIDNNIDPLKFSVQVYGPRMFRATVAQSAWSTPSSFNTVLTFGNASNITSPADYATAEFDGTESLEIVWDECIFSDEWSDGRRAYSQLVFQVPRGMTGRNREVALSYRVDRTVNGGYLDSYNLVRLVRLSWLPPVITAGSLARYPSAFQNEPPVSFLSNIPESQLTFEGERLGPLTDAQVTMERQNCPSTEDQACNLNCLVRSTVANVKVVCEIDALRVPGRNWVLTLHTREWSVDVPDRVHFPEPPVLSYMEPTDDSCLVVANNKTLCDTAGGMTLVVHGDKFVSGATFIDLDSKYLLPLDISPGEEKIATVLIPPGAGTYVPIIIRANGKESICERCFGYRAPEVYSITSPSGCTSDASHPLRVADCSRTSTSRLNVHGRFFGPPDAPIALLLGNIRVDASNVWHDTQKPHELLHADIPAGVGLNLEISLLVGGIAGEVLAFEGTTLSYATCGAGLEANSDNPTECVPCQPGTANDGSLSRCETCSSGYIAESPGAHECVPSAPGFRWMSESAQEPCHNGSYALTPASVQCSECRPGTYSPESPRFGVRECLPCPPGMVQENPGQSVCTPCEDFERSDSTGTKCVACGEAQQVDDRGDSCAPCPAGTHGTVGVSGCTPCRAGMQQPLLGQLQCTECPLGTAASKPGKDSCDICPAFTMASKTGLLECEPCRVGTVFAGGEARTGMTQCEFCVKGFYSPTVVELIKLDDLDVEAFVIDGYDELAERLADKKQDSSARGNLDIERARGTGPGSAAETRALAALQLERAQNAHAVANCEVCPEGADCDTPGVILAKENYWLFVDATTGIVEPRACLPGRCADARKSARCAEEWRHISELQQEQPGRVASVAVSCCGANREHASNNAFCGTCRHNYYEWGGACVSCTGSKDALLALAFFATWVFVLLFHVANQSTRGETKILVYYIQMAVLFFGPETEWLRWTQIANFSVATSTGADVCIAAFNPTAKMFIGIVAPLIAFAQLAVTAVVAWQLGKHRHRLPLFLRRRFTSGEDRGFEWAPFIRTTCGLAIFCYNSITDITLGFFNCRSVSTGSDSIHPGKVDTGVFDNYVQLYPALSCDSAEWKGLVAVMLIFLLGSVIGVPLAFALILRNGRRTGTLLTTRWLWRYGVICECYRVSSDDVSRLRSAALSDESANRLSQEELDDLGRLSWLSMPLLGWEVVVLIRRALLIALNVALSADRHALFQTLSLVQLLFLSTHAVVRPFARAMDNAFELLSLFMLTVLTVALSNTELPLSDAQQVTFAVAALLPAVLFLVFTVVRLTMRSAFSAQYIKIDQHVGHWISTRFDSASPHRACELLQRVHDLRNKRTIGDEGRAGAGAVELVCIDSDDPDMDRY